MLSPHSVLLPLLFISKVGNINWTYLRIIFESKSSLSVYKRLHLFIHSINYKKTKKKKLQKVVILSILLFLWKIKETLRLLKQGLKAYFEHLNVCRNCFITATTYQLKQIDAFVMTSMFRNECTIFRDGKKNNTF